MCILIPFTIGGKAEKIELKVTLPDWEEKPEPKRKSKWMEKKLKRYDK